MPASLQTAIDAEVDRQPAAALRSAAVALSERYAGHQASVVADDVAHAAYLATRAPATYAATAATLRMVPPTIRTGLHSLLDLGAGPGTATWAAHAECPALTSVTQVDRSRPLLALGQRLASSSGLAATLQITQRVGDVGAVVEWPVADLVIGAYALAELSPGGRGALLSSAWLAAGRVLALIEPGTPTGFAHLREARDVLLAAGAQMVAPCPHDRACPMRGDDWCHFAVRIPRSRRHRLLKGGTLGYEDEKYACLVLAREPQVRPAAARVLRHPLVEKGRVRMMLCTPDGAQNLTVTRHDPRYRLARKTDWGDAWDDDLPEGADDAG